MALVPSALLFSSPLESPYGPRREKLCLAGSSSRNTPFRRVGLVSNNEFSRVQDTLGSGLLFLRNFFMKWE